ncbi:hypothetical protein IOQ59_07490 [Pontibacterium sp. N1Y112]|uniref:Uncharacterized protein n=1 Tax=Pontibacterium sinense TaxID=2781979 RepID=A0A8J7FGK9_9GAMM|nr:hypothetical protein [Pontibacterium sinense]MBE9397103.1 hypothetical protein [Pontibacterium sinense]
MNHTQYDQTQLVHDIISLQSGFKLSSPDVDVLDYQWLLGDAAQRNGQLTATWRDQTWLGVVAD